MEYTIATFSSLGAKESDVLERTIVLLNTGQHRRWYFRCPNGTTDYSQITGGGIGLRKVLEVRKRAWTISLKEEHMVDIHQSLSKSLTLFDIAQ